MMSLAPREYLVKNLLLFGQVSMLAGPPNTGKTSLIASIAGHAAHGDSLGGRQVAKAATLYVAAEGPYGVVERGSAVLRDMRDDGLPFNVYPHSVDFDRGGDAQEMDVFGKALGDYIEGHRRRTALFGLDTLNSCL